MSSPYGYATGYIPTPPPRRPPARPPVRRPPITAATAPVPPNFRALLEQLAAGPSQRSEADWSTMLDARTAPFTNAINASTDQARAMNEYRYETKSAANQGLGAAFLGMLTGGRTGAEAEAYSKENFGGSYLGGQAMSMAADKLSELTADFDEGDWKISGQYLEAMQQVPAIREELRASIEKGEGDEYERKFKVATLLMDETWRAWEQKNKQFEFGVGSKEEKRQFDTQFKLAEQEQRVRLGLDAIGTATSAKNATTSAKSANIRAGQLALSQAKAEYAKAKDKVSQRQAQARIDTANRRLGLAQALDAAKLKLSKDKHKLALQREQRMSKTAKKGGFTAKQKQDMSETALLTATDGLEKGFEPVKVLRDLIASGIPFSIAIRAIQRWGREPNADPSWAATLGWTKGG